jgi:hypothetical protein
MKLQIAQYVANRKDGKFLDDAIANWTKLFNWSTPRYSHSELIFVDKGLCFSSATRGNFTGVRFAPIEEIIWQHPDRWDIFEKEFSPVVIGNIFAMAKTIEGCKYFYTGLFLDFFLPLDTIGHVVGDYSNQWYCSQSVWYALTGERARVSPRRLTTWLLKDGWKLLPKN